LYKRYEQEWAYNIRFVAFKAASTIFWDATHVVEQRCQSTRLYSVIFQKRGQVV